MGVNEALLLGAVFIDFAFIVFAARFGRSGLVLAAAVNMILVSTFAPKLFEVFGFVTNVGIIFYGAIFLASNLFIERYGKQSAYIAIWLAFSANVLFLTMGQFALRLVGATASAVPNDAITILFSITPRIALASIVAYLVVQHINIELYAFLKQKLEGRRLWLRHAVSVVFAQLLDSALFFTIAFYGVISHALLAEVMLAGLVLKILIGIAGIPGLYLVQAFVPLDESDKDDYVA